MHGAMRALALLEMEDVFHRCICKELIEVCTSLGHNVDLVCVVVQGLPIYNSLNTMSEAINSETTCTH